MPFVLPRVRAGSDVPTIHAANAVYALNEVRARRGGAVAGGVLWGRVVRVGEVVPVGTSGSYSANVLGEIRSDFMTLLPVAKEEASETEDLALAPLPPFLGENLSIKPHGGGTYRYLLGNADVTVKARKEDHAAGMAAATVELSAACLHRLGFRRALDELASWVALWAPAAKLQPSECDLCADTQGWQPTFEDFKGKREEWAFVCAVDKPTLMPYDGYLGYVRFGTGGRAGSRSGPSPIQAVIYDKTEEIRTHDKGWFVPLWAKNAAYRDGEIVTRVEFRFRREWMKERGIESQADLLGALAVMWAAGLEWCRYCVAPVEGADTNRSRLEVRDEWRVLRSLSWGGGAENPLQRIDQARPRLERTLAAIGGYFVTLQALFAHSMDADLADVAGLAVPACLRRWEERGEDFARKVEHRRLRLGGVAMV